MLLLATALIAAASTPAVPDAVRAGGKSAACPRTTGYYAWQRGQPVKPQKLTQLPSANAYFTVYRVIGGCEVPVVVRYGVGRR